MNGEQKQGVGRKTIHGSKSNHDNMDEDEVNARKKKLKKKSKVNDRLLVIVKNR